MSSLSKPTSTSSQGQCGNQGASGMATQGVQNVPPKGQNQGQWQGQGVSSLQQDMAFWRARVEDWYPKLQERTYFLPPVYMNTTGQQAVQIFGTEVFIKRLPADNVPKGVPDVLFNSTVKEDKSQQKVLQALHKVSEAGTEVMFVLSQLNFKDYLPSHSPSATPRLPTPRDLKSQNKDQGDFDVLVLHKHLGVLVGEIKSVGDNFQELGFSEQKQEQEIVKKVKQALKQLDKARDVLDHLTNDQQPPPRIIKTLMLPSISPAQLRQVLDNDPPLKDAICQCLDLPLSSDPIPHCMTSDDVPNPETWWQKRMAVNGPDQAMNDSVYLDLVSRFCGPATTVSVFCSSDPRLGHRPDVRTEGEGVSETGHRFTRFMVTPTQLTVLHVSPPLVFLVGPPGVGKTFVLILKALDWLGRGEHVLVLSTADKSEASSCMIYQQLEQTVMDPAAKSRIHLEHVEFGPTEDEDQAIQDAVALTVKHAQQGSLNIIADEAPWKDSMAFRNFCQELHDQMPKLRMWAASVFNKHRPSFMTEVRLTESLRSPPGVTYLVQRTLDLNPFNIYPHYTEGPSPLPAEGPWMREVLHDGAGHEEKVADCETCGDRVGRILKEELRVSEAGRGAGSPQPLAYRDVFVLSSHHLWDVEAGTLRGFLRGMQTIMGPHIGLMNPGPTGTTLAGVPMVSISDVATFQGPDVIAFGSSSQVAGLERKVIVYLGDMNDAPALFQSGVSRCTAQLVRVKTPAEHGLTALKAVKGQGKGAARC